MKTDAYTECRGAGHIAHEYSGRDRFSQGKLPRIARSAKPDKKSESIDLILRQVEILSNDWSNGLVPYEI